MKSERHLVPYRLNIFPTRLGLGPRTRSPVGKFEGFALALLLLPIVAALESADWIGDMRRLAGARLTSWIKR